MEVILLEDLTGVGSKGATVGNIVVNLQTKSGSNWTTRSSDVADATNGDAATSAHTDPHASRGKVVILDPKRLADASCECYGVIRTEYQRLLG